MGAVFRVHSALSERVEAALKVMKPSMEPDARARFVREAEALSALRHPAIIRVMGFSEDTRRGLLYLVMELAEGETLKRRLERGPMGLAEALATFVPLASGLEHAHAEGISHRDLKPSNVILSPDGVRLVDFGIAAAEQGSDLTGGGHLGTLSYMPPEVFRGERAEPRLIDVYAFGLLLNEVLTGQHPFPVEPGLTPAAAAATVGMRKIQQAALDPGDAAPKAIRDLVRRATDPDPKVRPDMAEAHRVLSSLVERRGGRAATATATAAATAEAAPSRLPAWTPPADATMRVPDPVMPRGGTTERTTSRTRRRFRERRKSVIVAWVASMLAAALFAALIILMLKSPKGGEGRSAAEGSPIPAASASARTARAARSASPAAPSPTASPSDARPSPSPSPSLRPSPSPSPSPSARPSPRPSVSDAPPLAPAAAAGAAADSSPPGDGAASDADVSGEWLLTNRVDSTDFAPYQGLRLGYVLTLRQDGDRVSGDGEKTSENGAPVPPAQRTPIAVTGRIENGTLTLHFNERGALRASSGTLRLRLSPDQDRLAGSFSSDAAGSRGSSSAQRVR